MKIFKAEERLVGLFPQLTQRFPLLPSGRNLPDELLDLFTPRTLVSLDEIVMQLATERDGRP